MIALNFAAKRLVVHLGIGTPTVSQSRNIAITCFLLPIVLTLFCFAVQVPMQAFGEDPFLVREATAKAARPKLINASETGRSEFQFIPLNEESLSPTDRFDSSGLFAGGLHHAEEFRQRLLASDANEFSHAELLGLALEQFLKECPVSVKDRTNLDEIPISSYGFLRQIRGDTSIDDFGMREGDSYSSLSTSYEHHNWHPLETFQPALQIPPIVPHVAAAQFDQTNSGFGWNYLVSFDGSVSRQSILGVYYMMNPVDLRTIQLRRPHVGYYVGKETSVWVSPTQVRIEHRRSSDPAEREATVVTGFSYVIRNGKLWSVGRGFQSVYAPHLNQRDRFSRFRLNLKVPRDI